MAKSKKIELLEARIRTLEGQAAEQQNRTDLREREFSNSQELALSCLSAANFARIDAENALRHAKGDAKVRVIRSQLRCARRASIDPVYAALRRLAIAFDSESCPSCDLRVELQGVASKVGVAIVVRRVAELCYENAWTLTPAVDHNLMNDKTPFKLGVASVDDQNSVKMFTAPRFDR